MHKLKRISAVQLRHWLFAFGLWAGVFLWLGSPVGMISQGGDVQRAFGALIAQISAGLMGVFITSIALVFALPERPFIATIRESGHFLDLCASLLSAILACLLVTVCGCIVALLDTPGLWLTALIAMFAPLVFVLFQAGLRLGITLIWVARPGSGSTTKH